MVQWFKQPIFDSRDYDSSRFRAGQSSDSQVSRPSQEDYGILSWRWDSWICWWIVIFPVVNPVNPREMRYRYLSVSGKILKIFAAPFYRNPKDYGAPEVRDPKGCSSGGSAPSFRFGHLREGQIQPHQRRSWHGGEAWCFAPIFCGSRVIRIPHPSHETWPTPPALDDCPIGDFGGSYVCRRVYI